MSQPLLVIATGNAHKTEEIRAILGDRFEVRDLSDYPDLVPAEETGTTFIENATLKAVGISQQIEGLVLSDDSGLEIDDLDREPGVYSARYAGPEASDADNRKKALLELNKRAPEAQPWSGRFRCVMALSENGESLASFDGAVEGTLIPEERGDGGFGYDSLFVPEGHDQTFAELPAATKNELSHRARALEKASAFLQERS